MVAVAASVAAAGAVAAAGISAGVSSSAAGSAKSAARDAQKLQQAGATGAFETNKFAQEYINAKLQVLAQQVYEKSIAAGNTVADAQRKAQEATYQAQQEAVRASTADNTKSQWDIYNQAISDIGKIHDVQVSASGESAKALSQASTGARDAQVLASQQGQGFLSGASKDAMLSQLAGSNLSDQQYQNAFNKIEAGFTPYTDAGLAALMGQQDLLGMNGQQAQAKAYQGIEGGQYKELARQGEDALLQNAAATGGVRGGNVAGALAQFRPSMLQALIEKQFNNLSGLRDTGYNAQGQVSGYQSGLGENLAQGAMFRGGVTAQNDINQGIYSAQSAQDIGGFNAQNALNQGNISSQDAINRGQYGAEAATSRGIAANTGLTNLNNINQNEINQRLQYFIQNQGANRDIENENILRSLGYDLDLLSSQAGADINRIDKNAQYFTDAINNYTGIGANAANTVGNINANKQLGIGKAISTGIGGLTGALSSYQEQPQYDKQQPQQYGFAGLRQQAPQINFNQGNPTSDFWTRR
jgi:hypothetical protein